MHDNTSPSHLLNLFPKVSSYNMTPSKIPASCRYVTLIFSFYYPFLPFFTFFLLIHHYLFSHLSIIKVPCKIVKLDIPLIRKRKLFNLVSVCIYATLRAGPLCSSEILNLFSQVSTTVWTFCYWGFIIGVYNKKGKVFDGLHGTVHDLLHYFFRTFISFSFGGERGRERASSR